MSDNKTVIVGDGSGGGGAVVAAVLVVLILIIAGWYFFVGPGTGTQTSNRTDINVNLPSIQAPKAS